MTRRPLLPGIMLSKEYLLRHADNRCKLGSYEIVGALGASGMGEVYRARDTKLKREVAIKVKVLHR